MSRVALPAVLLALLLTAAPAFADGALHPLACASLDSPAPSGCSHDDSLTLPYGIQVSADGRNAYGLSAGELEIYDRAADGTLTRKPGDAGCIAGPANTLGCKIVPAFGDGYGLGLSPDGRHLYTVANQAGAVLTFTRGDDGSLSFVQCVKNGTTDITGCPHGIRGLGAPLWVSVNPTDGTVYVAGTSSLASFEPQVDGTLAQRQGANGCDTATVVALCTNNPRLAGGVPQILATTQKLYARMPNTVMAMDPATFGLQGCQASNPDQNCGSAAPDVTGLGGMALAPDGAGLYTATANGIIRFSRDTSTGLLSGCEVSCAVATGTNISDVAVSPDGAQLYATHDTAAGSVLTYDRSASGSLQAKAAPYDCVAGPPTNCIPGPGLGNPHHLTVSPDGRNVYVDSNGNTFNPGSNTLTTYSRDRGPVCSDTGASSSFGTAVIMRLACSDPDGDPLAFSFPSGPAHGTLSAPGADGSVTYVPAAGFAGGDAFTYRVSAFGVSSGTGAATVSVASPPLSGVLPVTPATPVKKKLNVTVAHFWTIFLSTHRTVVKQLTVKKVPAGAKVQVRCSGKGCAFTRKTVKAKHGVAKLAPLFKQRRIARNATIEVRVTKPGYVGRVVRFKLTGKSTPKRTDLCLAPGAAKPGRC